MPAKSAKKNVPYIATEPTSHDISILLTSVTSYTTEEDRFKRAKMLWYKINCKEIPLDLFLSEDVFIDEYQDYIEKIIGDHQLTIAPSYSLEDIASSAYDGLKKRAITTNLKNYCSAHDIDYKDLKAKTFASHEAEALRRNLIKGEYPKSNKKSAKKAGLISVDLQFASKHPDAFERYIAMTYKDKTLDLLLLLWTMKKHKNTDFVKKSKDEKELLYGAMNSFRKEICEK